jgi:hypothetical protein
MVRRIDEELAWLSLCFLTDGLPRCVFSTNNINQQGLTGDGDVFLKAGGALIRRELTEGEQLRISSGCLVAFSNGVDYGTYKEQRRQRQRLSISLAKPCKHLFTYRPKTTTIYFCHDDKMCKWSKA